MQTSADNDLCDRALVQRVIAKDQEALAVLYDRYSKPVFSLLIRMVSQPSEAEEILQDVFWKFWQQAAKYDEHRGTVRTWLLIMARSRAIDHLRSLSEESRTGELTEAILRWESGSDLTWPEDVMAAHRVNVALQSLPARQRNAIELAYFEGLSQSEIARRLDQPLGTVKAHVRLGLVKLRKSLSTREIE